MFASVDVDADDDEDDGKAICSEDANVRERQRKTRERFFMMFEKVLFMSRSEVLN